MLIHPDKRRKLYKNVDVNKVFRISYMFYHVKIDAKFDFYGYLVYDSIELIFFLSRKLKDVEKRYWLTELKVAELV